MIVFITYTYLVSQQEPAAKINLPKGMENIMTSRPPARYAVDRSVDPERSPPSYKSPDQTDAPYSAENNVQPRDSAHYNTGNLFPLILPCCPKIFVGPTTIRNFQINGSRLCLGISYTLGRSTFVILTCTCWSTRHYTCKMFS